jgi:aryl-alcohol dehydrogenase-like predicted oxidoreductase
LKETTERIILGTVQIGMNYGINNSKGQPALEEAIQLLNVAYDNGVRSLDTAEAYGESISRIGKFHELHPDKKFKVISKVSSRGNSSKLEDVALKIKENLDELKIENFEAILLHRFDDINEHPQLMNCLQELKEGGLLKNVGCSIYDLFELESLLNDSRVDIVQLPFNLLDRRFAEGNLLKKIIDSGKKIHARSLFLQGLLFKKPEDLPEKLKDLNSVLMELKNISERNEVLISNLALSFAASIEQFDGLIIGVDSAEQLIKNIQELKKCLASNIIEEIKSIKVQRPELLDPRKW